MKLLVLLACALAACSPHPSPSPDAAPPAEAGTSELTISNTTDAGATVYAAFGSDSVVMGWSFCTPGQPLNCSFPLAAGASQGLPTDGGYLNVTFAFNAPVGCGATKSEVNMNNPAWTQDTIDISLVDGWNVDLQATAGGTQLGPTQGASGNSQVYGVFPLYCDICVARSQPSCGIDAGGCTTSGSCGCKSGTQYNPTVPCQWGGAKGQPLTLSLVP